VHQVLHKDHQHWPRASTTDKQALLSACVFNAATFKLKSIAFSTQPMAGPGNTIITKSVLYTAAWEKQNAQQEVTTLLQVLQKQQMITLVHAPPAITAV
jgi:hypothetical protein